MADFFKIVFEGIENLLDGFARMISELRGSGLRDAGEEAADLLVKAAREYAPKDTGQLANSIMANVESAWGGIEASVFTTLDYGVAQELGTRPFWPNAVAIDEWALRKFGDARIGFLVARKIAAFGIKPTLYMKRALDENEQAIVSIFDAKVERIVEGG